MSSAALLWADDLQAPLAWTRGKAVTRHQYLNDVHTLAATLPPDGAMLNLSSNRYRFAVGLGAALLRGQYNLMPPNHTPGMMTRLKALCPGAYVLVDQGGPTWPWHQVFFPAENKHSSPEKLPTIDARALVAKVFTSGSTGDPVPHEKHWGAMHLNVQAGARQLATAMGRADLNGVNLVATVPAQHMFGFESSVLVALLAGAAFDVERPFFPADIADALVRLPRPRMLVTTPFHLKMLLDAGLTLPAVDLVLCATAPLSPRLAARAESALLAPLLEIYGCTEAGQIATRRTTEGAEWQTLDGLRLEGEGENCCIRGGHVGQATALADVLEVLEPTRFRLLGRSADLINIAGKRSSLGHLNYHLNHIAGVEDGAFWLPVDTQADENGGVKRPVAFVVAREWSQQDAYRLVIEGLKHSVDAAFLPRLVCLVQELPREPGTGKLPAQRFDAWARDQMTSGPTPAQKFK
jgi:acyl-coenzyme A synthetase/AMP-(fatty) acid ligase